MTKEIQAIRAALTLNPNRCHGDCRSAVGTGCAERDVAYLLDELEKAVPRHTTPKDIEERIKWLDWGWEQEQKANDKLRDELSDALTKCYAAEEQLTKNAERWEAALVQVCWDRDQQAAKVLMLGREIQQLEDDYAAIKACTDALEKGIKDAADVLLKTLDP